MRTATRWLALASCITLIRCSDGTSSPPVTVTVEVTPAEIAPGQSVSAKVTVIPPADAAVDYVKIMTRGLLVSAESLDVHLAGTFTATRAFTVPLAAGTGSLTIEARAAAGGGVGNGQTVVAVADTVLPLITEFVATPVDTVQFGDSLSVSYATFDNVGLRYTLLRLSGGFVVRDSTNEQFRQFVQRTVRFRVPASATAGTVTPTLEVRDVGNHVVTSAIAPIRLTDTRPPVALGTVVNPSGHGGFAPGDSLRLTISARDNGRLTYVGYRFGAPASVQDSFPVADTTFTRTQGYLVPAAWDGTSSYSVFARDASGNRRETLFGTFTVSSRSRAAPWNVSLGGAVRDMAYDVKRNVLYASIPDSNRVAVLNLASQAFNTALVFSGNPRGLDLTLGGDSLLVALRLTPYVSVLNLVTGIRDTVRVNSDNFLNRGPDNVRLMANNKALVTVTFDGTGYGGSLTEVDLGTRGFQQRATVTEFVPLCRSGDRSTALILIDDSCCPIDGLVYDALTGGFPAHQGTVSRYFNVSSADVRGERFLINGTVFTRTLSTLGDITPTGAVGPSVIAPDGVTAYFATSTGLTRVRLSDGGFVESFNLGAQPYRLAISPDGNTIFAAAPDKIFVVDTW